MRLFQVLIPALFCLVSGAAFAGGTLVLSDIDDTLKVSHVNSALGKIGNGLRTDQVFPGMPELLQSLSANGAKVIYVSAAPEALLRGLHEEFLRNHDFPEGALYMSPGFSKESKLPVLRRILNEEQPETVILIGDNGEMDPANSAALVNEHPEIRFFTYIRWDYPNGQYSEFYERQVPFLTAGEVALSLNSQNILTDRQVSSILRASMPDSEELLGLPEWVDCEGYNPLNFIFPNAQRLVDDLLESISVRCPSSNF